MKRVAFTICSSNYLARANVAGRTFLTHHQAYEFVIFLVDRLLPEVDYGVVAGIELIEIHDVVANIDELASRYNIVELNTAVKPDAFLYLFAHRQCDAVIYLDPDVMVTSRFQEIEALLDDGGTNIIITPHGCSPIDDGLVPSEINLMMYGIYNLGFLVVSNSAESLRFLNWWHDRLMKYCYIRPDIGLFTDQIWINYVPSYFSGVHILKHLGYNVAHWNLYERGMALRGEAYFVNETTPLRFFHFSHYPFQTPHTISPQQNRHVIGDFASLDSLIDDYQARIVAGKHAYYRQLPCAYVKPVTGAPRTISGARRMLRAFYRAGHRVSPRHATFAALSARAILESWRQATAGSSTRDE